MSEVGEDSGREAEHGGRAWRGRAAVSSHLAAPELCRFYFLDGNWRRADLQCRLEELNGTGPCHTFH